jgi:hypothetical protein
MTNLKSMGEIFWGKEFEDILDWIERLKIASKVRGYNEMKLFKSTKLNM